MGLFMELSTSSLHVFYMGLLYFTGNTAKNIPNVTLTVTSCLHKGKFKYDSTYK